MLVISILATTVVGADTGLFNGNAGLSLIPNPLASVGRLPRGAGTTSRWWSAVCVLGYLALRRFTTGPFGRVLRAVRDDEDAAIAVGKNVVGLGSAVQAVGGVDAGLSGALLAGFIGGWSPTSWAYVETLALLTAIIVGGLGNDAGVLARHGRRAGADLAGGAVPAAGQERPAAGRRPRLDHPGAAHDRVRVHPAAGPDPGTPPPLQPARRRTA